MTVVADGCFSKFRKEFSDAQPMVSGNFVGLILKDCPLPAPNHGHVILADPSPILLYQIGTHDTRILVDIPGQKLPSAGNGDLARYLREKVAPQLPEMTQASFLEALTRDRIRSMPNQFLPAVRTGKKGVILLGDASNMRHPLTGGGMTVGLNDVHILTQGLSKLESFEDYSKVEKVLKRVWVDRKPMSSVINVLSVALYDLFAAGTGMFLPCPLIFKMKTLNYCGMLVLDTFCLEEEPFPIQCPCWVEFSHLPCYYSFISLQLHFMPLVWS